MKGSRSTRRPIRGIDDIAPQSIDRYHLIDDKFPGIDEYGKLKLDQNNGTPVPLDQIPSPLTGKDTDSVDGYHAADLIRPVNITILANGAAVSWLGQPIVLTEFLGGTRHRLKFDQSKFTKARLIVNVVYSGADGAELRVQYSTDQSSWFYLDGLAGPGVGIC